jgi:CMP-N,N'-diacetyllegionaminic acid synthase
VPKILAVITARGGSKGLPGKNTKALVGRPLINYSIAAARAASGIDRIIVSTDATDIADIARLAGAEVPFMRPAELATDETPTIPVLTHVLEWLAEHESYAPDYLLLLQPTSPLRTAADIEAAITIATDKNADGVVSVSEPSTHPFLTKRLADDGHLVEAFPQDPPITRRQDLPTFYALNGAIYLIRADVLLKKHTFYTEKTFPYIMPIERSWDIDTENDFLHCERLLAGG